MTQITHTPYTLWPTRKTADPRAATQAQFVHGLTEILQYQAPMQALSLFQTYAKASGLLKIAAPPGFADNDRREYCPECAEIWGVLSYYPAIQQSVEMTYQPIAKPRADLVALLGDKNQNCPTLVLAEGSPELQKFVTSF